MLNDLEPITIFVHIVNEGSFTAAAEALGLSKGHVSQQLKSLEQRLGVPLLIRTTRTQSLTAAGEVFYRRCLPLLEGFEEAEQEILQYQTKATGLLRVSLPNLFGGRFVVPKLGEFLQGHPDLKVDFYFSSKPIDIVESGFDVGVQIGSTLNPDVVSHTVTSTRFYLCASPDYLKAFNMPLSVSDLSTHQGVVFTESGVTKPWYLCKDQQEQHVDMPRRCCFNSGQALLEAAVQGLGIAYLPDYYILESLKKGELILVLPEWSNNERAINLLYGDSRFIPLKVRLFVEYIKQQFEKPLWKEIEEWQASTC